MSIEHPIASDSEAPINNKTLRKSYAYRLDPTDEQIALLYDYAKGARFVFNWGLGQIKEVFDAYRAEKDADPEKDKERPKRPKLPNFFYLCPKLTEFKQLPEGSWLYRTPSQVLQQSIKDLDTAMKNFWRRLKEKRAGASEKAGFPRFKSYKTDDAIRFSSCSKINNTHIFLTKIGWIRYRNSRPIEGVIRQVTVKRDGKHWYAYVSCIMTKTIVMAPQDNKVELKLGITDKKITIVADTRKPINSPSFHEKELGRIETLNQALSRKVKNSKNRANVITKIQDVHRNIRNKRKDFLHKWSNKFVEQHNVIVVEKLPVKQMMQDEQLSLALSDIGWHQFVLMLKYKCEERGKWFFEKEVELAEELKKPKKVRKTKVPADKAL